MKKNFAVIILYSITVTLFCQDLIVTNDGDSIQCKITKVKSDHLYFTFKHKDELRSTLLPVSNIRSHQFDYFENVEIPKKDFVGYQNYQHLRIAVNAGYSHHIAKISENVQPDFKEYVRELKSGYHFGADITYFITEQIGFGAKYYMFKSSNNIDNIYIEDESGNIRYGKMSDDLSISFVGPNISTRLLNAQKANAFIMTLSLGYMGYSNNKIIIDPYKMTGSTVGLSLDLGYDIRLYENIFLGFQFSIISGSLFEYKWDDGKTVETIKLENGEYESLHRIDLSIGLRFGI